MKRSFYFIVPVLLLLCSCEKYEPYIEGNGFKQSLSELNCFDFKTEREVYVDINYGLSGPGALLNLYTYDPVSYEMGGCFSLEGEPSFKIFADENGRFCGNVLLPTYAKKLWVVSTSCGAPFCLTADIVDGKAVLDASQLGRWNVKKTRAGEMPKDLYQLEGTSSGEGKLYALTKWNRYGKVTEDPFRVVTNNVPSISNDDFKELQKELWNGGTKNDNLDNTGRVVSTEHTNISIASKYDDGNGETTVEYSEVWFNFIDEEGWYMNTIGYYYYKTGEEPDSPKDLDKFILIPNASKGGHPPFWDKKFGYAQWFDYGSANAPCAMNTKVQLMYRYEDEQGVHVTKNFPPGITIGFFILPKKNSTSDNLTTGVFSHPEVEGAYKIEDIKDAIYSNSKWNKSRKHKNKETNELEDYYAHTIALELKDGKVVFGFEDSSENFTMEDILFSIESNPILAIKDPDRNSIVLPEPVNKPIENYIYRTYLYEDIWPSGGDYDLNDAVVEHVAKITSDKNNVVQKVEDTFKVIRSDADYRNAFAINIKNPDDKASIQGTIIDLSLPEECIEEKDGCTNIILFDNLKGQVGNEVKITRTFDGLTFGELDLSTEVLNPFIIAQYDGPKKHGRTEIHLAKHAHTIYVEETLYKEDLESQSNNAHYYNYVKADGKHPYALSLPYLNFIPSPEGINIEKFYPEYPGWVESEEENKINTDWYKFPQYNVSQ